MAHRFFRSYESQKKKKLAFTKLLKADGGFTVISELGEATTELGCLLRKFSECRKQWRRKIEAAKCKIKIRQKIITNSSLAKLSGSHCYLTCQSTRDSGAQSKSRSFASNCNTPSLPNCLSNYNPTCFNFFSIYSFNLKPASMWRILALVAGIDVT